MAEEDNHLSSCLSGSRFSLFLATSHEQAADDVFHTESWYRRWRSRSMFWVLEVQGLVLNVGGGVSFHHPPCLHGNFRGNLKDLIIS